MQTSDIERRNAEVAQLEATTTRLRAERDLLRIQLNCTNPTGDKATYKLTDAQYEGGCQLDLDAANLGD